MNAPEDGTRGCILVFGIPSFVSKNCSHEKAVIFVLLDTSPRGIHR